MCFFKITDGRERNDIIESHIFKLDRLRLNCFLEELFLMYLKKINFEGLTKMLLL